MTCALLLAVALATVGCAGVEVSRSPAAPDVAATALDSGFQRDLALTGVQMEPELSRAIVTPSGCTSFELLVSVENQGRQAENDVLIEAWLRAPVQQGGMVLMQGAGMAPLIASGETQVVRLSASGTVPILTSYVLVVSARPALDESYLGNNVAEYEITISALDDSQS